MKNNIKQLIEKLTKNQNGLFDTSLDSVRIFRSDVSVQKQPHLYARSLIILLSGKKFCYFKDHKVFYDSSNYFVALSSVPVESEAFAEPGEPILGLTIDVDLLLLQQIINEMNIENYTNDLDDAAPRLTYTAPITPRMTSLLELLAFQLQSYEEAKILGKDTIKAIYYEMLKEKKLAPLYHLLDHRSNLSCIINVMKYIENNISSRFEISALSEQCFMSKSNFHALFKRATGLSPIQYIKKAKLLQAKYLMLAYGYNVSKASLKVGYGSTTQFNREFKREFDQTPTECLREYDHLKNYAEDTACT